MTHAGVRLGRARPAEKQRITVTIDPAASNHPLQVWDTGADDWSTVDGAYDVRVGNASDNITLTDTTTVRTPAGHQK